MKISIEATQKELVELVNALQNQQLKGVDAKKIAEAVSGFIQTIPDKTSATVTTESQCVTVVKDGNDISVVVESEDCIKASADSISQS